MLAMFCSACWCATIPSTVTAALSFDESTSRRLCRRSGREREPRRQGAARGQTRCSQAVVIRDDGTPLKLAGVPTCIFGWPRVPCCLRYWTVRNAPAKKTSGSVMGGMRRSSTRPTTIQWSPAGCSATISHSREMRASVSSGAPPGPGSQSRPANRSAPAGVARTANRSCCRPSRFTPKRRVRRIRDPRSESRLGQNEISGGSSETDVSEFTISPAGAPSGAAVTKATPVAKRPSASRNERGSGADAAGAAAASAISVELRGFAEGDVGEVVVGAVGAQWVHEGAGLDVAVGAREWAAVQVAGAAGEGERAVHGAGGGLVDERLGGLSLGEQRAELRGAAVGGGVGGAMLVDQRGRARQDAARGGEVDGVVGDLHARARIAVDAPGDAAAGDRVGRLGDAERGGGVEQAGHQVALHVRQRIARCEAA